MSITGLKRYVFLASTLVVLPLYLCFKLLAYFGNKNEVFTTFSQFLSLIPGKSGSFLRNSFYYLTLTDCQPGVVFSFGTLLSQIDTDIASGTYIGPQCNIGSCRIGKDCLIGSGVHILSGKQQHAFDDLETPIREQGGCFTKIRIGNDCWIGNGAIVMADIGDQCVVAAGAVVITPLENRSIVGGNPAVVIKHRNP